MLRRAKAAYFFYGAQPSDEALRLYARLNDDTYATWVDAAGNAAIDSVRTSNVASLAAVAAIEHAGG